MEKYWTRMCVCVCVFVSVERYKRNDERRDPSNASGRERVRVVTIFLRYTGSVHTAADRVKENKNGITALRQRQQQRSACMRPKAFPYWIGRSLARALCLSPVRALAPSALAPSGSADDYIESIRSTGDAEKESEIARKRKTASNRVK